MTDGARWAGSGSDGQPTVEQSALAPDAVAAQPGGSPVVTPVPVPPAALDERPELAVGAAFAGGLVLGLLLKRLAR